MAGETDTLPAGGTDNATLTEDDTLGSFNFFEPEPDTEEEDQRPGTDGETAEASGTEQPETDSADDANAEVNEANADDDAAGEGTEQPETDSVVIAEDRAIELPGGDSVTFAELKKGYLRQADFTRKTQELANSRKGVFDQAERMDRIVESFVDFLAKQVPDEPDAALAYADPQRYMAQKAQYDATMGNLQRLIQYAEQPKTVAKEITAEQAQERRAQEFAALAEAVPETATEKGRERFFADVLKAGESVGFTEAEFRSVQDHRLLVLGHYAAKGIAAEKARAAAKAKVVNVPPVSQPKRTKNADVQKRSDAMQRLSRTGSIDDAVKAYLARQ